MKARPAIRWDYESVRAFVPAERPTVYRIYEAGILVYVGASAKPRARLFKQLIRGIPGDTVELEFCRTETAMLRTERDACAEEPVLNSVFPGRHRDWSVRGR